MCEIKDSLTALELSCMTHTEQSTLEDNEILSQSVKRNTSHGRHCHDGGETKGNKSSQNSVTLLHNPFLSLSPLHI